MSKAIVDGLRERISNAISYNQSVGIILPGNNYNDLTQALFEYIYSKPESAWVYVTITKTYNNILKDFGDIIIDQNNIRFIDCISRAAGLYYNAPNCVFIESPSQLERIILEIMNQFKMLDKNINKYLVLDSLSSLLIYNNSSLIKEFITHLNNRTIIEDIHNISLSIEEEMDEKFSRIIYLKNKKIIKLKESFI
jgi:hypothetical protein